ncbi:hypothetical protein TTHT_1189 [Thermotomaculum hydrothermale]|uniref:ATP synthase I n=1 Tax=Thermotomaculum hydrothermale TaxID=981385 RepID=A0A7R6PFD2_9BACT|nr:ATP synthase subunit I [Thermotomaculum hydrothermale]BBB32718.1 hypothetical protein TTHT_1189 [Thermotomaculum hydrothermale]
MKTERLVKIASLIYFICGILFFTFKRDFYGILNFAAGFILVFVNFIYLEKLTLSVTSKNPSQAKVIILINLIRYPLIALIIYGIIQWKNFKAIPFVIGMTALVFGLFLSPISGGIKKNGS